MKHPTNSNHEPKTWLTRREACEHLNISQNTLLRMQKKGEIKSYYLMNKVIRYKLSELDAAVEKNVSVFTR